MGSLLAGTHAAQIGPVIAILGLCGAGAALAIARPGGGKPLRLPLLIFAWSMFVMLTLLIPDVSVLQNMAYGLLGVYAKFSWPVLNKFSCIAGGLLWGATALAYQRRLRWFCQNCGRSEQGTAPWARRVLCRWGKWLTYLAAFLPLPYAISRWAWALGIPLGITQESLDQLLQISFMERISLFMLGGVCIGGAVLTLGLTQRWGEIFPGWIPFLAGKQVPPALAIIPASLVSIAVIVAGRVLYSWTLPTLPDEGITAVDGSSLPGLLWLPWGLALGAATLDYYYRRRGVCSRCGHGEKSDRASVPIADRRL
jgi:hypothetical protein